MPSAGRRPSGSSPAGAWPSRPSSLLAPIAVTYDAWGWLIWGRELWHGTLDTTGGPSWKPLPVVATAFLAPFGTTLAPALWLVLARTLGLLALVAVYRLAARWGGAVAGVAAVVALLLTPDRRSPFARLLLEGHTAPLTVTFALWAISRHLDGHRTQALVLVHGRRPPASGGVAVPRRVRGVAVVAAASVRDRSSWPRS